MKSSQPEAEYKRRQSPNTDVRSAVAAVGPACVCVCVCVWECVYFRYRVNYSASASNEENVCSSHAPLKHEKHCWRAGRQPKQHSIWSVKTLTWTSLKDNSGVFQLKAYFSNLRGLKVSSLLEDQSGVELCHWLRTWKTMEINHFLKFI